MYLFLYLYLIYTYVGTHAYIFNISYIKHMYPAQITINIDERQWVITYHCSFFVEPIKVHYFLHL